MSVLRLGLIVLSSVVGAAAIGNAQPQQGPAVQIDSFAEPRIMIMPIVQGDPVASLVSGDLAGLAPFSFYVKNSGKNILAIIFVSNVPSPIGPSTLATRRTAQSGYLTIGLPPVIRANSRAVVVGSQMVPEQNFASAMSNPGFKNQAQAEMKQLAGFASVHTWIDCVIFDDGEVVGSDTSGYVQELTDQRTAAGNIVALYNQAKASGTPLSTALSSFLNSHANPLTDKIGGWQKRFAESLIHAPSAEANIKFLTQLPVGPKLFNTTTGAKQ